MSIKPIDLQVLLGKIQEVARTQQNQEHTPILNQQMAADQSIREIERQMTQVQQTPETEGGKVENREEGRKRHQPEGREERKQKGSEKDENFLKDPARGNIIDIEL